VILLQVELSKFKPENKIMRAILYLSVLIHLTVKTRQDDQYLDFEDSLDIFESCSIHLVHIDLEVSRLSKYT